MVSEQSRANRWVVKERSQQAGNPFRGFRRQIVDKAGDQKLPENREPVIVPSLRSELQMGSLIKWAYGVTTVPSRLETTLPVTLKSLAVAGFDNPRLFIDGATEQDSRRYLDFGLEMTCRFPRVRTYANWILSLWELYARNPAADLYAMFQDDFVTYQNLRGFLEKTSQPDKGYLNLYSFSTNEPLLNDRNYRCWLQAGLENSARPYQTGRGAVALVFNREAVTILLSSPNMVLKPQDVHRGWRLVDGAIVTAMNHAGWREYIFNPSLVQHTGYPSTTSGARHRQALTFMGEKFDALELLA